MNGQYEDFRSSKPVVAAFAGFVLITLVSQLDGVAAQGCQLIARTVWLAFELFHAVLLLVNSQAVTAYLLQDSGFIQHSLQMLASLWSLVFVLAC